MSIKTDKHDHTPWGALISTACVPVMIIAVAKQRIIAVNDGFSRMFGWSDDDAQRLHLTQLIGHDAVNELCQALKGEEDVPRRARIHCKVTGKNTQTYASILDVSISGDIIGSHAFCVIYDVPSAEDAVPRIRETPIYDAYANLIAEMPIGVIIVTTDGVIQCCNEAAQKVCGQSACTLPCSLERMPTFFTEDGAIYSPFDHVCAGESVTSVKVQVNDEQVSPHEVIVHAFALSRHGSVAEAVVILLEDMTEVHTLHARYKQLESRIHQMQKLQTLGVLAGGIAHDFNNILCAVIGFCELAYDVTDPASPTRKYLDEILHGAKRAETLAHQILAFSRPGEGKQIPLIPDALFRDIIVILRASFPSTVTIDYLTEDTGVMVYADSIILNEMMMHLAKNAYESFAHETGVLRITCTTYTCTEAHTRRIGTLAPGTYCKVTCEDNGCGMTEEVLTQAFDPYFSTRQLGSGTGTGCGLPRVAAIVEGHHGAMDIESRPGEGTTVSIFFPCYTENAVLGGASVPSLTSVHDKVRIVLLDDNENIVFLYMLSLEGLGYIVHPCHTVQDVYDVFAEHGADIDILITDQTMPEKTGVELAKELRNRHGDLSIIICSGYSDIKKYETDARHGIDAFLSKPVSRAVLTQTIQRLLDKKKKNE